ncbi:MAG: AbrB/MazE/SpoVT family DNA-binding domain-containing protein [Candidatus Omnitrophica bacterium]|nr:AbrB/MazE/SpoVT family DNA-binding domain-containing protein [Candidatus Omnitrophota bacterium]
MTTTVQKWGNSLALRIPIAFARNIHLRRGSEVDLVMTKDKIEIRPAKPGKKYVLSEMIRKINKKNVHSETEWGTVGREML